MHAIISIKSSNYKNRGILPFRTPYIGVHGDKLKASVAAYVLHAHSGHPIGIQSVLIIKEVSIFQRRPHNYRGVPLTVIKIFFGYRLTVIDQ